VSGNRDSAKRNRPKAYELASRVSAPITHRKLAYQSASHERHQMDINSISNIYNTYLADNAKKASDTASSINTSKDYSKATDEELMDVCKQFEAYFLEQCFKEMLKTVDTDDYSSASTSTMVDYYKDEMVQKLASESTENNSLGLAQMLYEQMKRNYDL